MVTQELSKLIGKIDPLKTLVVFPGNGAKIVKDYTVNLNLDIARGIEIPTKRVETRNGQFKIAFELPDSLSPRPEEILVVDDVVASGQTCRELACALARKYGILPKMKIACWLMLSNSQFLPYYEQVYSSMIVKPSSIVSRPPINSLSCLLSSEDKYNEAKRQYFSKYFKNSISFEQLKQLVMKGKK
jgi:hypoxanthine phosphoribosyltransferase